MRRIRDKYWMESCCPMQCEQLFYVETFGRISKKNIALKYYGCFIYMHEWIKLS